MAQPVARLSDNVFCPADIHTLPPGVPTPFPVAGAIVAGSTKTMVFGLPLARVGDQGVHAACAGPNTFEVDSGSVKVYDLDQQVARLADFTKHCGDVPPSRGTILTGAFTVLAD